MAVLLENEDSRRNEVLLYSKDGVTINLRCESTTEGVTLIECLEPRKLLNHLEVEGNYKFTSECYLKGAVIPGEGAFFDLFDTFGALVRDVVRLDEKQSYDLLTSQI